MFGKVCDARHEMFVKIISTAACISEYLLDQIALGIKNFFYGKERYPRVVGRISHVSEISVIFRSAWKRIEPLPKNMLYLGSFFLVRFFLRGNKISKIIEQSDHAGIIINNSVFSERKSEQNNALREYLKNYAVNLAAEELHSSAE